MEEWLQAEHEGPELCPPMIPKPIVSISGPQVLKLWNGSRQAEMGDS